MPQFPLAHREGRPRFSDEGQVLRAPPWFCVGFSGRGGQPTGGGLPRALSSVLGVGSGSGADSAALPDLAFEAPTLGA